MSGEMPPKPPKVAHILAGKQDRPRSVAESLRKMNKQSAINHDLSEDLPRFLVTTCGNGGRTLPQVRRGG